MTVPRNYLMRYCVTGYKDDKKREEFFNSGRDAWIMESYLKRNGYRGVRISVKWIEPPYMGGFFMCYNEHKGIPK